MSDKGRSLTAGWFSPSGEIAISRSQLAPGVGRDCFIILFFRQRRRESSDESPSSETKLRGGEDEGEMRGR